MTLAALTEAFSDLHHLPQHFHHETPDCDREEDRPIPDPYVDYNAFKLAGLQVTTFSYARLLPGPVWFACGGDIKQPP